MSITATFRHGIAFAMISVVFTVLAFAQTTPTMESPTPAADAIPSVPTATNVPGAAAVPPMGALPFGTGQPGMPGTAPYGAMPGMGMPPAAMGAGTMPMGTGGGMPPMGMRGGAALGYDPEMNALMARRLQELQSQLTLLNSEITMLGGGTSQAARPLLAQRIMLQGQIRELELQINPAGATTPATPGVSGMATTPLATMPPGMPGMPGYGSAAPTAADMMARNMAGQGMPSAMSGYGMTGMPGMPGAMGAGAMRDQLRQEAIQELQFAQQTLRYMDANDPMRATIEARQTELLAQVESLNQQPGQNLPQPPMSGAVAPGAAGSVAPSLADRIARQPGQPGTMAHPQIAQLQNAERQMRAMDNIAIADDLKRQIEQLQTQAFAEPQLPGGMAMPMMPSRAAVPTTVPPTMPTTLPAPLPQQGELAELRTTVDSLRSEITSLRDEIRALQTLLRQNNPVPLPTPASEPADTLPTYMVE